MNRRHRAAQLAGRASVQLHTLIFFAGGEDEEEGSGDGGGGAKEEDAYVLDVETSDTTEPSFRVMVPRYGIEGKVRLPNLDKDECLVRDPEKQRLLYKDASTGEILASVAVFDKVRVKIWVKSSRDRKELIVDLLDPMIFSTAGKPKKKKQKTKQ
jgi:exosome complex exonuclease DIS3/RRP44